MPSNFHLRCFLIWTTAIICLSNCAPTPEKSIWEKFISEFNKHGCKFPYYVIPKDYDLADEQGNSSPDTYDLALPLKACIDVEEDSDELPLCSEIFDIIYNISTCGSDFNILAESKQVSQLIDIEMQTDKVCEGFLQNRNIFTTDNSISFKLIDQVVCPFVCKKGDLAKACSFLLWGHRIQSVVHEKVKEAALKKALPDNENGFPGGQDTKDEPGENIQKKVHTKQDEKKTQHEEVPNDNTVDTGTKVASQGIKNLGQKQKTTDDPGVSGAESKLFEKKKSNSSGYTGSKSVPESITTNGKNSPEKITSKILKSLSENTMLNSSNMPNVKGKSTKSKTFLLSSGEMQSQKESDSENSKDTRSNVLNEPVEQQRDKNVEDSFESLNKIHSGSKAGTQLMKSGSPGVNHDVLTNNHNDSSGGNEDHKAAASSTSGNNLKTAFNVSEETGTNNGGTHSSDGEETGPNENEETYSNYTGETDSNGDEQTDTSHQGETDSNGSGKADANKDEKTVEVKATDTNKDGAADTSKGGETDTINGSETNIRKGVEISVNKDTETDTKNEAEASVKKSLEISTKKDSETITKKGTETSKAAETVPKETSVKSSQTKEEKDLIAEIDETPIGETPIGNTGDSEEDRFPITNENDNGGQFDMKNSDEYDYDVLPEVSSNTKSEHEDNAVQGQVPPSHDNTGNAEAKFIPGGVGFPEQEDTHFFFYFITIVIFAIGGYVLFHNKQKIFALIIEGRHERRRRSGASYRKLETK